MLFEVGTQAEGIEFVLAVADFVGCILIVVHAKFFLLVYVLNSFFLHLNHLILSGGRFLGRRRFELLQR